ncbi:Uncharacterised protein [Yersinia kristensenii]|nr:Uncharacterised protein [Yersinia kristensenii]
MQTKAVYKAIAAVAKDLSESGIAKEQSDMLSKDFNLEV